MSKDELQLAMSPWGMPTKRKISKKAGAEEMSVVTPRPYEPSSKSYFRIVIAFGVASLILICTVLYFVFYGARVHIIPQKLPVSAEAIYEVRENPLSINAVKGGVMVLEEEKSKTFTVAGEKKTVPDYAHGSVIIYNNGGRAQALMATTRFLSEPSAAEAKEGKGGVLFRIRKNAIVPAGGTVAAEIFADQMGIAGNVPAGKFTLPGLSAPLQKLIYAKSSETMAGGEKIGSTITTDNIQAARNELQADLGALLKKRIVDSLSSRGDVTDIAFSEEIVSQEASRAAGEEASDFDLKIRLRVVGVSWGNDLVAKAAEILSSLYPSGRELTASNLESLQPKIVKYSEADGAATVSVNVQGVTIPAMNNEFLDSIHFAGLGKDEILKYLADKKLAESAEIKFFPFWLKAAPTNPSHIQVIIQK